ncbi:MAG: hypothetical protein K6F28_04485 [Lachnospiraceae bacterium]|nr:hypothetical protein [Lachnospiraceae bacterium]
MAELLSTVIVVVALGFVFKKIKEQGTAAGKSGTNKGASGPSRSRTFTNYRPHKDIISVSRDMNDRNNSVLRDDKTNDWLARQLREEHRAFKATSEMFDLKIEHASHCDARLLEQFHKRNCDANGIDLANGSTLSR